MAKLHGEMQIRSILTQDMLVANSQKINNQYYIEKESGFYPKVQSIAFTTVSNSLSCQENSAFTKHPFSP